MMWLRIPAGDEGKLKLGRNPVRELLLDDLLLVDSDDNREKKERGQTLLF